MPFSHRLYNILLRLFQLVFAVIVAGLVGYYLDSQDKIHVWRFIYTEAVAGISVILAMLCLIRCNNTTVVPFPMDLLLFALWMVAFGILVNLVASLQCGHAFNLDHATGSSLCNQWKATVAFCFVSSILWLMSGLMGITFIYRERRSMVNNTAVINDGTVNDNLVNDGADASTTELNTYCRRPRANTVLDTSRVV